MEYEIMSEDKDNYHLWGETEDGGGVFTFPKVIRVQTGVICSPTNHAEIRAKALADKKKIDEAVKVIEGWTK